MKTAIRMILSRLAFSRVFYRAIERTYNFTTLSRFKGVSRSQLDELYEQVSISKVKSDFDLIRVGSSNDGGYVMVNPISSSASVISLGIADNMDFELELIDKHLVSTIFCFDGSIERLPAENEAIRFEPKYVKVEESKNSLTLSNILAKIDGDQLILKIDIEGDEWDVLHSLSSTQLSRFSQIIGEFHGLASDVLDKEVRKKIELLQRISLDFYLVNSHPNNWAQFRIIHGVAIPDVIELTFIKKSIFESSSESKLIENPKGNLNSPCNPSKPDYLFH